VKINKIIYHRLRDFRWTLFGSVIVHTLRWLILPEFRRSRSLISPSDKFYYKGYYLLAKYVYWILRPLAQYFMRNKIFISINNLSWAIGHIYPEIDFLHRARKLDYKYIDSTILYVYPNNPILKGIKNIISTAEVKIITSGITNFILYPLAMRYPEISIDTGQSSICHSLDKDFNLPIPHSHINTFRVRQVLYAELRKKTSKFYPLRTVRSLSRSLSEFVGSHKYIVIQIKDIRVNATFNPVNPQTYCLAIQEFSKKGYRVVFAGREKMPDIFKKLNVINYSESKFASGENDYDLILNASFVIASSSGFCFIPDCLDIPLLSVNNWQINGYIGRKTIQIPSLLNINNQKILFSNQINHFYDLGQIGPDTKAPIGWEVIDASAEDILLASKEMIRLSHNNFTDLQTSLQITYNSLFPFDLPSKGMSRTSHDFLTKNFDRF
jgi:putative glycosyltransferase (TIGR04372 family)